MEFNKMEKVWKMGDILQSWVKFIVGTVGYSSVDKSGDKWQLVQLKYGGVQFMETNEIEQSLIIW